MISQARRAPLPRCWLPGVLGVLTICAVAAELVASRPRSAAAQQQRVVESTHGAPMRGAAVGAARAQLDLPKPAVSADRILPQGVAALVECGDPSALLAGVRRLVTQIEPRAPEMILDLAPLLTTQLFKTSAVGSVDLSRPVRLVILDPPLHASPVWIFGLKDAGAYLDGILIREQDAVGDVRVFRGVEGDFAVAIRGQRAVAGDSAEAVGKVAAMVAADRLVGRPLLREGDISFVLPVRRLMATLDKAGMDPFEAARDWVGAMPPATAVAQKAADAFVPFAEGLVAEVEELALGLSLEDDALVASVRVQMDGKGVLASYAGTIPKQAPELLKYMPADAAYLTAAKVGEPEVFIGPLVEVLEELRGELPHDTASAEAAGLVAQILRKAGAAVGGEVADAQAPRKGRGMVVCSARSVKDAEAWKTLETAMQDARDRLQALEPRLNEELGLGGDEEGIQIDFDGAFREFHGPPGLPGLVSSVEALDLIERMKVGEQVRPNALQYRGKGIDEIRFTFEFPEPEVPRLPDQVAEEQARTARARAQIQKALDLTYGAERKAYRVFDGSVMLYACGPGALEELKAMIDGRGRLRGTAGFAGATSRVPAPPAAVVSVSIPDIFNWTLDAGRSVAPDDPLMEFVDDLRIGAAPPIVAAAAVEQNTLRATAYIPFGALKSIYEFFSKGAFVDVWDVGPE